MRILTSSETRVPSPHVSSSVRRATIADLDAVRDLLGAAGLPVEGVAEHFHTFLVAESGESVIGAMGLEVYGATALLRSAVVAGDHQRSGVGTTLFVRLLDLARDEKVAQLVLLTNTAESYFRRKGFRTVDANAITGPIRQSTEFTGACPSTAVCMELTL